ncbi:MAG: hypothetical protein JJ992_00355 [Planctomycetes bacterium]|nr:hypothetical protein [Planctomycetota bacterium]
MSTFLPLRHRCLALSLLPIVCLVVGRPLHAAGPTQAAREAAKQIRHEALLPPNGPEGRPLPLLGHWNMGSQGRGWTPQYQLELLDKGTHLLPWFGWPQGDPDKDEKAAERFNDYYGSLMRCSRQLGLPISFRGTQWEAMLVGKEYRSLPPEECPAVVTPEGKAIGKLSPFGPVQRWRDPAAVYVDTPAMKKLQQMYPDPPLVLFLSNNEAPDLRWHQAESLSQRYLDKYGTGRPDDFKREVVARGWMERYPVMFQAMREALISPEWKKNVRFVGYGAFGPSHFGRWSGWKDYSLITDQWTSPDWYIWDGGSPSYYTHNWCPNRDHWVWSTQVQSMNWIFQLEEAWKVNPDFWWEISTWDGNGGWTPGTPYDPELLPKSKACQYMKDGQTYTPDRHLGWIHSGMWLLRPRVVREFRGSTVPLEPWRPFFDQVILAVDRVYADATLTDFWRHGELVANRAHEHPYQEDVPEKYRNVPRWFLLDTNLDAAWPWDQQTNIPVFSLALVRGEPGARQWLLYAHSPLEDRRDVEITLPGFGPVVVDVPRSGVFCMVDERNAKAAPLRLK